MTNMRVTLIAVGVSVLVVVPLAVLLAVCLSGRGRLLPLFRTLLFLPIVIPLSAAALMWSEIFSPAGGLANEVLKVIGVGPVNWLGESQTAFWSVVVVTIWSLAGIHIMIQLSALSAIPTELKEAARLETASAWRVFRHVVLPLLREALTVSAVLIITGTFVYYTALAFIMTGGGPVHATESLGLRAYIDSFQSFDYGSANAATMLTMLVTIVLVGVTLFIGSRSRVEY
jgi:raffinose/stachyose/melibiose transport system permease protein